MAIENAWTLSEHTGVGWRPLKIFEAVPHSRLLPIDPRLAGVAKLFLEMNVSVDPSTVTADHVQLTCDGSPHPGTVTVSAQPYGGCGYDGLSLTLGERLPDGACCTLSLDGMLTIYGKPFVDALAITPLIGDTDGSGSVLASDMLGIKAYVGQTAWDDNVRYDLDGNGVILASDMLLIKTYIGNTAPDCP